MLLSVKSGKLLTTSSSHLSCNCVCSCQEGFCRAAGACYPGGLAVRFSNLPNFVTQQAWYVVNGSGWAYSFQNNVWYFFQAYQCPNDWSHGMCSFGATGGQAVIYVPRFNSLITPDVDSCTCCDLSTLSEQRYFTPRVSLTNFDYSTGAILRNPDNSPRFRLRFGNVFDWNTHPGSSGFLWNACSIGYKGTRFTGPTYGCTGTAYREAELTFASWQLDGTALCGTYTHSGHSIFCEGDQNAPYNYTNNYWGSMAAEVRDTNIWPATFVDPIPGVALDSSHCSNMERNVCMSDCKQPILCNNCGTVMPASYTMIVGSYDSGMGECIAGMPAPGTALVLNIDYAYMYIQCRWGIDVNQAHGSFTLQWVYPRWRIISLIVTCPNFPSNTWLGPVDFSGCNPQGIYTNTAPGYPDGSIPTLTIV